MTSDERPWLSVEEIEKIILLPVEDTVWTVHSELLTEADDSDDEETEMVLVSIVDRTCKTVGLLSRDSNCDTDALIIDAIKQTALSPFTWKSRRPKIIQFSNIKSNERIKSCLSLMHIAVAGEGCTKLIQPRTCCVCRRRGEHPLFHTCLRCGLTLYCSKGCEAEDSKPPREHTKDCVLMKTCEAKTQALDPLSFTFTQETSNLSFDNESKDAFLRQQGIEADGLWSHEFSQYSCKSTQEYGALWNTDMETCLGSQASPLLTPPCDPPACLQGWEDYYQWRGVPPGAPLAAVLTHVLTVYHITATLLPKHFADVYTNIIASGKILIHLVGASKEADMRALFQELQLLLPWPNIHLVVIGPEIGKKYHGKFFSDANFKFSIHKGLYHKYQGDKPDIIIGLNSGLSAYGTWAPTLQRIKELGVPAYFSDYDLLICALAQRALQRSSVADISECDSNPFRSPLRTYCEEHCMAWFSNAYIFHLTY